MESPEIAPRWEALTTLEGLQGAGLVEYRVGSILILLAWVGEGAAARPWAGSGLCTHQFTRLVEGRIAAGRLHCPAHKASFCLATGEADRGWQIPPLRLYPVRVVAGVVEVDLAGRL